MNKLKISIFTLAISLIAFSCGETTEGTIGNDKHNSEVKIEEQSVAKNVNADEFKALIEKGGILIDVRTPGEVANGAIAGNKNINIGSSDFEAEISKLDKNSPVLVYCKSGGRSGRAMGIMKGMGFKEVYNLNGGYSRWPNK